MSDVCGLRTIPTCRTSSGRNLTSAKGLQQSRLAGWVADVESPQKGWVAVFLGTRRAEAEPVPATLRVVRT